MAKKDRALTKKIRVGIAAVGADQARTAVRHRIDDELGTVLLAEAHNLPAESSFRPTNAQVLSEVAATTAEVLASHLSNYVGSEDQKGKVAISEADFAGFIRQSIVGTESIAIDTALHAQVADGKTHHHIATLKGKAKDDPSFGAVALSETFPAITCNLEVAVLYPGGAHLAHRGQSRQYLIKNNSVEQLTHDYNSGGLLSSLDALGDFLPKVELKQIAMSPQDRLVILSQGAFPKGLPIDPQSLRQGRSEAPEKHAAAIAQKVARNNVNPGYIIVIELIDEKKEGQGQSRLGKPSTTQADPPKSKTASSQASLPAGLPKPKTASSQASLPANLGSTLSSHKEISKVVETPPAANSGRRVEASQASTAAQQKSELSKPTLPPLPVPTASIPAPKPEASVSASKPGSLFEAGVVQSPPKQRHASHKELEDSGLFTPAELADLRTRAKARFERELRSFEQDMVRHLEQEMAGMGKRIASQVAASLPSPQALSGYPSSPPFPSAAIPPPDNAPYATQTSASDRPAPAPDPYSEQFSVVDLSPARPPLPVGTRQRAAPIIAAPIIAAPIVAAPDDDYELPIPPAGQSKKAALGRLILTCKTAWTGALNELKPWAVRLGYRLVGLNARLGLWTVRGHRPFARPWVAPVALAGLIVLIVLIPVSLLKPQLKTFTPSQAEPWVGFSSAVELTHASHLQNLSSMYEQLRFFPRQPPEDRSDAYSVGRRLYLDCNNGKNERGDRLSQYECISSLLGAILYLKTALESDAPDQVLSPDIWFVIARSHFHLARLGHERRKNARAAVAAYKEYRTAVPFPTVAKQGAIDFDHKLLKRWLQ